MKIKIKDSIEIFEKENGNYVFLFSGSRKYQEFKVDDLIKNILDNLQEPSEKSDLIKKLNKYSELKINKALNSLEKIQVIRSYGEDIDKKFERQYSFMEEFTSSDQETQKIMEDLKNTKISVFGLGGIGSWIAKGLSQIGIGSLILCDPDKVSYSNLNRQLFFRSKDIGKYKVDVISENLDLKIDSFKKFVSSKESLDEMIFSSDLIVNCADDPDVYKTSKILNVYSEKYNLPLCIGGGYNLHNGFVGPIFVPNKTASLKDFIKYQKQNNFFEGLNPIRISTQTGSISSLAGIVSNIQCLEIFKHLTKIGEPNYNKFAEVNFSNSNIKWINFD